jgi:hypothetical protein
LKCVLAWEEMEGCGHSTAVKQIPSNIAHGVQVVVRMLNEMHRNTQNLQVLKTRLSAALCDCVYNMCQCYETIDVDHATCKKKDTLKEAALSNKMWG